MERSNTLEEKNQESSSPPLPATAFGKLPLKVPMAVGGARSNSPKMSKTSMKPAFNRPFKQATFENRGKQDGSSNLYVSFTSETSHKSRADLAAQIAQRSAAAQSKVRSDAMLSRTAPIRTIQPQPVPLPPSQKLPAQEAPGEALSKGIIIPTHPLQTPSSVSHPKPKSKSGIPLYKDIITIDKKKIAEEVDNLPKPDHLLDAEKELLAFTSVKAFSQEFVVPYKHPCVGCNDVFPSQFALDDHLNRQSYQLTLDCPQCYRKLNFTNKCRMYEHLSSEHRIADKAHCSQLAAMYVTLQVLPRAQIKLTNPAAAAVQVSANGAGDVDEKMDTGAAPEAENGATNDSNLADSKAELDSTGEPKPTKNGSVSPPKLASPTNQQSPKQKTNGGSAVPDIASEEEEESAVNCTECSRTFETEYTIQTHFSIPSSDAKEPEVCIPCRTELPTPCARRAHMRVHSLTEPYVCPDCGVRMFKKNVFLKHLRLHCLHYSVLSEFTCPGCPSNSFSTADEQLAHLKANPSHLRFDGEKSYYKCNGCPKAFKSVAAHSKHETCPGAGCTVVHMCNNCPQQTVFRSWNELTEHRAQAHPDLVWKAKRSKVFSCYLCAHKCRTKPGLLDHLLKTHGKKKIDFMCNFCGVETDSRQSLDTHKEYCQFKDIGKGAVRQAIPERLPKLSSSSSVVSDHSTTPNGTANHNDNTASVPTSPSAAAAGSAPLKAGGEPELVRPISSISYLAHAPSFNCHLCTAEYSTYTKLRDHVTRRHDGQGMIYECWLCRDKGNTANFYRQTALDKHMADNHKIQIATPAPPVANGDQNGSITNGVDHDSDDETPAKKLKIWSDEQQPYQCCRCPFLSTNAQDFKDHVKEHKTSADSHQCNECGMCFTVQLALRRHLIAVHKVYNYAKYSRTQYMAEFEKQLSDTQGKCPVCAAQFDDDLQLRKHMRTHGMMYINTKRVVAT